MIGGGESGPKARPMHIDWAREPRDQCIEQRVPFFLQAKGWQHPWRRQKHIGRAAVAAIPRRRDRQRRLQALPGIGMALSRMAVLVPVRIYGLLGGQSSLAQLDVKPDVHVMRVFRRCGFIGSRQTRMDAVRAARALHPPFPAALAAPTYNIGRQWCRPTLGHLTANPGHCVSNGPAMYLSEQPFVARIARSPLRPPTFRR